MEGYKSGLLSAPPAPGLPLQPHGPENPASALSPRTDTPAGPGAGASTFLVYLSFRPERSPTSLAVWPAWPLGPPALAPARLPGVRGPHGHGPCSPGTLWPHLAAVSSRTCAPCSPRRPHCRERESWSALCPPWAAAMPVPQSVCLATGKGQVGRRGSQSTALLPHGTVTFQAYCSQRPGRKAARAELGCSWSLGTARLAASHGLAYGPWVTS